MRVLKEIQLKLSELKENKARNEATIEGIENRKKDLLHSVKNELTTDEKILFYENYETIESYVSNIKNLAKEEYFKGKNPRTTPIMIEIKVFFNYKIN